MNIPSYDDERSVNLAHDERNLRRLPEQLDWIGYKLSYLHVIDQVRSSVQCRRSTSCARIAVHDVYVSSIHHDVVVCTQHAHLDDETFRRNA